MASSTEIIFSSPANGRDLETHSKPFLLSGMFELREFNHLALPVNQSWWKINVLSQNKSYSSPLHIHWHLVHSVTIDCTIQTKRDTIHPNMSQFFVTWGMVVMGDVVQGGSFSDM